VRALASFLALIERMSIWTAFSIAVAFAGFQAGGLGAHLAFSSPNVDFGRVSGIRVFDKSFSQEVLPTIDTVAAIFGNPEESQPVVRPAPIEIAENTDYSLQGVTVAVQGRWAMLDAGGANVLVREGDTLANGEMVKEITPTAVVLSRDGELTILQFTRAGSSEISTQNSDRAAIMADFNTVEDKPDVPRVTTVTALEKPARPIETLEVEQPPMKIQALRRALYAPNALSSVQFIRARVSGGAIGWQLKWIKDSPLVEAAGLQRGDVLVAINGVAIVDVKGLQNLLLGLPRLDKIDIEYERRQRPIRVTIPLEKS
jgi:type II secretory pathway component PulC